MNSREFLTILLLSGKFWEFSSAEFIIDCSPLPIKTFSTPKLPKALTSAAAKEF